MKTPTNCPNCNYLLDTHSGNMEAIGCHNDQFVCKYSIVYYINNSINIYIYSKENLLKFRYSLSDLSLEIFMNYEVVSTIENYIVDDDLTNIFNLFKKYEGNLLFL